MNKVILTLIAVLFIVVVYIRYNGKPYIFSNQYKLRDAKKMTIGIKIEERIHSKSVFNGILLLNDSLQLELPYGTIPVFTFLDFVQVGDSILKDANSKIVKVRKSNGDVKEWQIYR